MRLLLRSFALLDAISLIFMGMQLWFITKHFDQIAKQSEKIEAILMYPMFLMVLIGAIGLFINKKFGFICYYFQFPFRLYLWVFTLGFITWFPELLEVYDDTWPNILLKVCFVGEFIRLYLTIKTQLKLKDLQLH